MSGTGHADNARLLQKFLSESLILPLSCPFQPHIHQIIAVNPQIFISHIRNLLINRQRADNEQNRKTKLEHHQHPAQLTRTRPRCKRTAQNNDGIKIGKIKSGIAPREHSGYNRNTKKNEKNLNTEKIGRERLIDQIAKRRQNQNDHDQRQNGGEHGHHERFAHKLPNQNGFMRPNSLANPDFSGALRRTRSR